MNLKIRLKLSDITKLIFGGNVMLADPFNNTIFIVSRGEDTRISRK